MKHLDPTYFFSIWPAIGCVAVALAFVCLPMFRATEATAQAPGRARGIDGLRGFLALSVVIHHAAIHRDFVLQGVWGVGGVSRPYHAAGPIAVAMFFMITAFLFWSRVIREHGQSDWIGLFIGRLFRIAPVYLAAIFAMFAYIAVADRGELKTAPMALLHQVLGYMALGLVDADDVNGFPQTWLLLAGITWTLRWEWYFYASLPLIAFAARRPGWHLPFTLAAVLGITAWAVAAPCREASLTLLFAIGMACASLRARGFILWAPPASLSAAAALLLAGAVLLSSADFGVPAAFLAGGAFYVIAVTGNTMFGLLTSRAAVRLGEVSFGVYMLHGLALTLLLRTEVGRFAAAESPALYWLLAAGSIVLTLACALLAHVVVERPGIDLGRNLAHHISNWPRGGRLLVRPRT